MLLYVVKSVVMLVTNPFVQKKPYLHSILACRFQIARKGQKIAIREVYMSTLTDTKVPASSKDLILEHTSTHVTTPTSFESQNCGNKVHSSVRARLGGVSRKKMFVRNAWMLSYS